MIFLVVCIIMLTLSMVLALIAILQIKMAGMNVNDFFFFIKANEMLDKLYAFSVKYDKLSPQQQIIFMQEADKVFSAFDKVPDQLWEEEYDKYMKILDKYQNIKMVRWEEASK